MATKKELENRIKKQLDRQNNFIKENYKRVGLTIKKEVYSDILEKYGENIKLNTYINNLILSDLAKKEVENSEQEKT